MKQDKKIEEAKKRIEACTKATESPVFDFTPEIVQQSDIVTNVGTKKLTWWKRILKFLFGWI